MIQKFSVLMSCYKNDNPDHLNIAIESIFNSSLLPDQYVIVKDGPLTKKQNLIIDRFKDKYPGIIKITSLKENVGLGKALCLGLLNCSYNYVARMDSDDICNVRRFELQLNYMVQNPEIDILGSNISEFNNSMYIETSERVVPENHNEIIKTMRYKSALNHVSVMFKKKSVISSGNYQDFKIEDYQLWVKMIMNGCKFYNLQEKLVHVRIGNDMIGRRSGLGYLRHEHKLLREFYDLKFINIFQFIFLFSIKTIIRSLPKSILVKFYSTFMR